MPVVKFPIHDTKILTYMGNYYKLSKESQALAELWLAESVPDQLRYQVRATVELLVKDKE